MDEKSYYSRLFIALAMVLLFGVIVLQYVCPTSDCQLLHLASLSSRLGSRAPGDRADGSGDPYSSEDGALARFEPRFNFTTKDLNRVVSFNIKGDDVIVFLHIQKTGGTTFGRHLVRNIQLERPCECHAGQKKCTCYRPGKRDTWLFSRFSTGWSCGLHADWTELTNCVPSFMSNRESREMRKTPRWDRCLQKQPVVCLGLSVYQLACGLMKLKKIGQTNKWISFVMVLGNCMMSRCASPRIVLVQRWSLLASQLCGDKRTPTGRAQPHDVCFYSAHSCNRGPVIIITHPFRRPWGETACWHQNICHSLRPVL